MAPFETITIDATVAACDGDGGALGHPKVYLNLAPSGTAECPYCSRRFVNRGDGGRGRAGGGSRVAGRRRQRGSGKGGVNEISAAVVDKPPVVPGPAKPPEALRPRGGAAPRLSDRRLGLHLSRLFRPCRRPQSRAVSAGNRTACRPKSLCYSATCWINTGARPTPITWRSSSTRPGSSFRNRIYDHYKANRRDLAGGPRPAIRTCAAGGGRLRHLPDRDDGFEADDLIATYARHAVEAGAAVTIVSSDKDLMQLVSDRVKMRRPDDRSADRRGRGAREVRRRPGQGHRRAGAVRRQHRQRSGRAGDRGQDRGRADQHLWRPRNGARARRRDQAAEAARGADRQRRQGAIVEGTGQARRRRAAALPVVGAADQAIRPREAVSVSRRDGAAHSQDADRSAVSTTPAAAAAAAERRAGHPGGAAVFGTDAAMR